MPLRARLAALVFRAFAPSRDVADGRTLVPVRAEPISPERRAFLAEIREGALDGIRERFRFLFRCTRCGRDEVDARANGCTLGPCPMEATEGTRQAVDDMIARTHVERAGHFDVPRIGA